MIGFLKHTEIGPIPNGWSTKTFDEIIRKHPTKKHQVTTNQYQGFGIYPVVDQGKDLVCGFCDYENKVFKVPVEGALVFGDHTCVTKFVDFDFVVGADGTQVLTGKNGQLTRFIAYDLQARPIEATGYNRHFKFLKDRLFAAPPADEQKAIVHALGDIDDLIMSLDALIAKKRDIKQGAMQQLLTAKRRLPGFSGEWDVRPLLTGLSQRATYGIVKGGVFQDSGVYMLRGGDISDGRIVGIPPFVSAAKSQEFSRTILNHEDVVISLVGYPGECAVIPDWLEGGNISRAVGLLRPNARLKSSFLLCYLNSPVGRRVFLTPSAGSAQIVVNLNELNRMPMPFPKIDEQLAIAEAVGAFSVELIELERRRSKLADIRRGMMQQLLIGRIRLG